MNSQRALWSFVSHVEWFFFFVMSWWKHVSNNPYEWNSLYESMSGINSLYHSFLSPSPSLCVSFCVQKREVRSYAALSRGAQRRAWRWRWGAGWLGRPAGSPQMEAWTATALRESKETRTHSHIYHKVQWEQFVHTQQKTNLIWLIMLGFTRPNPHNTLGRLIKFYFQFHFPFWLPTITKTR